MDKRLAKLHRRKVDRAKQRVRLSEPDLRTPEQIKAARAASRPAEPQGRRPDIRSSGPPFRTKPAATTGSAAKTDA